MTGLVALWLLSVLLAASSLVIMLGLIGARLVRQAMARRVQLRRDALAHQLLRWLERGDAEPHELAISPRDLPLAADLLREILTLIKGEDRKRLIDLFSQLGVASYLRRQLKRRSAEAAMNAAELLIHFPSVEMRAALASALGHRSARVRIAAAISLCELDPWFPVDELVATLKIGTEVHSHLALDLFRRLAPNQKDQVLRIAQDEDMAFPIRAMALEALATTGEYGLVEPLSRMALAGSAEIKAKALEALGLLGHPAAARAVAAALHDEHWLVREEAAVAAGLVGLGDLADDLKLLLRDEIWSVRFQAGEALVKLGQSGIAKLAEARQSGSQVERRAAALILAEKGLT